MLFLTHTRLHVFLEFKVQCKMKMLILLDTFYLLQDLKLAIFTEYLLFWLKSVHTYCDNDAPVIIVGTHLDQTRGQVCSIYFIQ
jgi:GTPase SAR1 family protein